MNVDSGKGFEKDRDGFRDDFNVESGKCEMNYMEGRKIEKTI